jgi:hypothetical protein
MHVTTCVHALCPLQRLRALKCLRRVLNGLSTKRFVMEPPKPGARTAFIGAWAVNLWHLTQAYVGCTLTTAFHDATPHTTWLM